MMFTRTIKSKEELCALIEDAVRVLPFDGKPYIVTIKRTKRPRSLKANGLYWKWLMCIEGETGQDRDSLHEFFKRKFLEWQERTICGETMMVAPSTTTLDSHAFSQYMEKVRMFALELNIFLPYPEDKGYNEFYEQYS